MLKRMFVGTLVLAVCSAVLADYIADRKAAVTLRQKRKYEEAKAAFLKMAAGEVSDFQKADALEQAAECAMRLKRYGEATKLANRIPLAPNSETMKMAILMGQRKWKVVVGTYKDEDFSKWPCPLAAKAYQLRGRAYAILRDGKAAEADLKKSLDYVASKFGQARIWLDLGANYQGLLKDEDLALEAYAEAINRLRGAGSWINLGAVTSSAAILTKQQKYNKAFEVLNTVDASKLTGYWRGAILAGHAEALAAQGKKDEAVAKFSEAIAVKGLPGYRKKQWEKRIKDLRGKAK